MAKKQQASIQNIVTLSPQAMAALGLSQQPFVDTILSADAIYSHASLTQLRDTIKHHLQFSELLLIIEGEYGSGKTTLFRQLMQNEIPNVFLMPIQAEATDTLVQIQQKLSIHLKEQGDANYLDENLKNLQVFDQTPVLMIDDAHVLSDTTLQEIIRYRQQLLSEKELTIKLLLFANRGMAGTIEQISDLQHSQLFVQEMPALSSKQIPSFIGHRLAVAGAPQPPLLDDRQVQAIFKKSAGRPLQVMQQATTILEKLSRKPTGGFKLALPGKSARLFAALTALAGVAIAGYFLVLAPQQPDSLSSQPSPTRQPVLPQPMETPAQQPPQISNAEPEVPETGPMQIQEAPASPQQQPEALDPPTPDLLAEETALLPATEEAAAAQEPDSQTAPPASGDSTLADEPIAEPPAKQTPVPEPTPAAAVKITPVKIPAAPPRVNTAPALNPELQALGQLGIKDRDWLLLQDPGHWTLQILGAREPATLVKFAKQYQLGANTAWYATELKGKPWYVLVHRFYTDKDVARQSIARLPAGLQQAKPWVKSVASVQQAIR